MEWHDSQSNEKLEKFLVVVTASGSIPSPTRGVDAARASKQRRSLGWKLRGKGGGGGGREIEGERKGNGSRSRERAREREGTEGRQREDEGVILHRGLT